MTLKRRARKYTPMNKTKPNKIKLTMAVAMIYNGTLRQVATVFA